jgi:hypothetical protein
MEEDDLTEFWQGFSASLGKSYDIGKQVRDLNSLLAWQPYLDGFEPTHTDRLIAD